MKGLRVGLLVVALGAVAALVGASLRDAPRPDPARGDDALARLHPSPDVATVPSSSVRDAPPESERITIVVADVATGSMLSGVSCFGLAEQRLYVDPDSTPLIGVSDNAGQVQFASALSETAFVLTYPGYVSTVVDRQPGVRTYTATMQRGVTLTFTASTREGIAVEGVTIAVAPAEEGLKAELEDQITTLGPGVGRKARAVAVTGRDGRVEIAPVRPGALSWVVWHPSSTAVSFEPVEWAMHPELVPGGQVRVLLDPVVGMHFAVSDPVLNWMAKTPKGLHLPGTGVRDLELRRRRILSIDPTGCTVCVLYAVGRDLSGGYARVPEQAHISILTEAFGWTDVAAEIRPLSALVEPQFVDLGARPSIRPTTRVQMLWQAETALPTITNEQVLLTPVAGDPLERHRQIVLRPGQQEVVPCGVYLLEATNPFLVNVLRDRRVSIEPTTQTVEVPIGGLRSVEIVAVDASIGAGVKGTVRISSGDTSRTVTFRGDRVRSLVPAGAIHVYAEFGRKSGEVTIHVVEHGQEIQVPLAPTR
jgi:hypothetical protein